MKWILCFVVLFLCAISGFLGLTAGINLNPESTVKFVPSWGSLGDWVSGTGALLAVLVTLWLADKQRREDVESLKVGLVMGMMSHGPDALFASVNVTSDGKRPVLITGVTFMSNHAKQAMHVTGFMSFGNSLPIRLNYGEQAQFPLEFGFENALNSFVRAHCNGRADGLRVVVSTSLNEFSKPVPVSMLSMNRN
ncbi:hypothetical protein [Pseudomonas canadensis]|uniref:hypothetical protein n=1 Tax=Pseudomonas canadensis TaxID=915099 RepID=UPI0028120E05|nr:hypothetical protein [Pseudomonas canadensis]